MPFIIIGLITLIAGIYFLRLGQKIESKETMVGAIALIIASLILIIFFGLIYRELTFLTA